MPKNADCPECEYCCLIGLCCPPAEQLNALVAAFVKAGSTPEAAQMHAQVIVDAKSRMQHP